MSQSKIVEAIEKRSVIDGAADPIQRAVTDLLGRAPGLKRALHGEWLGHSLHAALTDVPLGAWTAGMILDLAATQERRYRPGADAVMAIGLAGSLGAAVTGFADWTYVEDDAKRLGFVHGMLNVMVAGFFGGSLLLRARRRRAAGVALSSVGYVLSLASAWLGRELTYTEGANVQTIGLPAHRTPFGGAPIAARPQAAM